MSQEIYISYAWGDSKEKGESREAIVNEIYTQLTELGLTILRDKKDVNYKGNIKAFEERLGRSGYIILVVSDNFLKSPNCMYEILMITEHKNVYNRVFPIVLSDASIYDDTHVIDYIDYWNDQKTQLEKRIKESKDISFTTNVLAQLKIYARIANLFDEFAQLLQEMNTLSPQMHRESNFSQLVSAIRQQMEKDDAAPHTQPAGEEENTDPEKSTIKDVGIVAKGDVHQQGKYVSGRDMEINH